MERNRDRATCWLHNAIHKTQKMQVLSQQVGGQNGTMGSLGVVAVVCEHTRVSEFLNAVNFI